MIEAELVQHHLKIATMDLEYASKSSPIPARYPRPFGIGIDADDDMPGYPTECISLSLQI
jgi:hypothetical protein